MQKSKKVKKEQLSCSNLRHLEAMVDCAIRPGVVSVCKIFHVSNDSKLLVDIISDDGKTWTKGVVCLVFKIFRLIKLCSVMLFNVLL